jgi:hypothetical protein
VFGAIARGDHHQLQRPAGALTELVSTREQDARNAASHGAEACQSNAQGGFGHAGTGMGPPLSGLRIMPRAAPSRQPESAETSRGTRRMRWNSLCMGRRPGFTPSGAASAGDQEVSQMRQPLVPNS